MTPDEAQTWLERIPGVMKTAGDKGLGLRIMHYQAQLIGGTLCVTSADEFGTTMRCTPPQETAVSAG